MCVIYRHEIKHVIHTHTHTHTHIYIYICVCVCVCVFVDKTTAVLYRNARVTGYVRKL